MIAHLRRTLAVVLFTLCQFAGVRFAHAVQYSFFGPVASDTTWADTVTVTGDVVITPTGHLHLSPGVHVRFQARTSGYDDLDGNQFRCDIIVKGALSVEGGTAPSDSVVFTSTAQNPAGGDWGYVYFKPESRDDISSITGASFRFGMENLYLYLSAPAIKNSSFALAQFYGLQADSSNSTPINDCVFLQNGRYGLYMIGSSPTVLHCQFLRNGADPPYTSDLGAVYLQASSGRIAQCLFQDQTAIGTVAITLASAAVTVAQDSFVHNTGIGIFLNGSTYATIDSCTFLDGKIGISAFAGGIVRNCYFEGMFNAAIEAVPSVDACASTNKGKYTFPVIGGGSLATANTFRNNFIAVRDSVDCAVAVQARYNDWGAITQDSILAMCRGGVDISPWTDPTHTQIYSTTQWGPITQNTTWSGTHILLGDVMVMPGVTLTLDAGTRIVMAATKSNWDSLHIQDGLCDFLVQGTLIANGGTAAGDSIVMTSGQAVPAAGDWGGIFVDEHASALLIGVLSEYAYNGFLSHGSPSFVSCAARFCTNDGFKLENNGHPVVSDCDAGSCYIGLHILQGSSATGLPSAVVTQSRFHENALDGVNATDTGVSMLLSGCRIDNNLQDGLVMNGLNATVSDCTITGNSVYGVEGLNALGVLTFGVQGHPNKVYGNATAGIYAQVKSTTQTTTSLFNAAYNYWGSVSEDAIVAAITDGFGSGVTNYPIAYSPWTDSTGTMTYSTVRYGTVPRDTTWSGTVQLTGDIVVPQGVTLTLQPGTTVKARAKASSSDDPAGQVGAVDLVVAGNLHALGTSGAGNGITFTSNSVTPSTSGNEWGRIIFQDTSDDASTLQYATLGAGRGMRCLNAAPLLMNDSLAAALDTSLVLVGQCPRGIGNGIAVSTSGSNRVGIALYGNTGLLNGWRTTKGGTGIVIRGGAPTLKGISVTDAKTGIACMGGATPTLDGCAIKSGVSNSSLLVVMEGAQPHVEHTLLQTTAADGISANGVIVRNAGTRPDLGGGPRGSAGQNAFKGFDGLTRFAVIDSASSSDTTWVMSNFWGTTRADSIGSFILDRSDDATLGTVLFQPPLSDDPTPAPLWALRASANATGAGVSLAWTGAPRTQVRVWRMSGDDVGLWPAGFTLAGTALTDAQGAGRFDDPSAVPGEPYIYALTSLGEESTPLATFAVGATPLALALDVVSRAGGARPRVRLSLPIAGEVTLDAFNAAGRRVARVWHGPLAAGTHTMTWMAPGGRQTEPAGVYWLALTAPGGTRTAKVLVVR